MTDHEDMDERDDRLRELARDYHRPPATPREEIWAASGVLPGTSAN